jgi:hypothetical protein
MQDDMKIIGIIPDRDFDGRLTLKEIRKILFDCLQLGPMFNPLVDVLKKNNKIDNEYVEFKDIC